MLVNNATTFCDYNFTGGDMKKKRVAILAGIGLLGIIMALICLYPHWKVVSKDFERLKSEEYDTLVMSMYPIDYYKESDYMHYRGMDAVQMVYCIPNATIMGWYMDNAKNSGNYLERVYMGIDPEHISGKELTEIIQRNPEMFFEIVIIYPQIDYWTKMSESKFEKVMKQYREVAEEVLALENINLYSFGTEEWLIANPKNYVDEINTNEAVSEFLMCNTDYLHPYGVNRENLDDKLAEYRTLYLKYQKHEGYPDATNKEIIFFGDSIIGNYTDSLSVPEVVSALSGAKVYNLGFGGKSAALNEDTEVAFPQVVEAFLSGNTQSLPGESQVYAGINAYIQNKDGDAPKTFVVNYGLNDYFSGVPLETQDAYDMNSYAGALRAGVKLLQNAYPKAQILLMTPHFSINYNFGKDIRGEFGGNLEAYANVVVEVAKEMNVEVLNNFQEFPISNENWKEYQPDGTHLNEKGRFLLGERIAGRIKENK